MLAPPHSLHWLRRLLCTHMLEPPHSLHPLRRLPCPHMPAPPHSLHLLRCLLPCSQRRCLRIMLLPLAGLTLTGGTLACVRRVRDAVTTAAGCSSSESEESSSAFAVGRRSRALAGGGTWWRPAWLSGSVQPQSIEPLITRRDSFERAGLCHAFLETVREKTVFLSLDEGLCVSELEGTFFVP